MSIVKLKYTMSQMWHNIIQHIQREIGWIKKSIEYAKFLRGDYDFDYSSMLKLLKYKIERMRKTIRNNNYVLKAEEICAQMEHAESLLQQLIDDDFGDEEYKAHNKKWGVDFFPKDSTKWKVCHNVKTPSDEAQMRQEFRDIMKKQDDLRKECEQQFFNHLAKYYRWWWD
jgi:hypothetical protein